VKEITHENFTNEVLTTNNVVLLDIWAAWCAPCIGMVPIVDKLAEELSGKITVAKLDAEASPELIAELGITSLPTF
jgi:thioredoxin 1